MKIANTFFKKRDGRRWTWESPDGRTKNEIDFVITDKINTIKDITTMNKIDVGSDHRFLRARIELDTKLERKLIGSVNKNINYSNLKQNREKFQLQLRNRFSLLEVHNLEEYNENLTEIIAQEAENVGGHQRGQPRNEASDRTKELIKRRKEITMRSEEDRKICKDLQKEINKERRNDKRKQNVETVEKALREGKSLKKVKQSQTFQSNQIHRLREGTGEIISNRRRLVERVQEFYQELYDSKGNLEPVEISQKEQREPPILPSEVRHVIKTMKPGKTPREDKITVDMLKEGGEELDQELAILYNYCQLHRKYPKNGTTQ